MCWEDWRIMARCRQVKTEVYLAGAVTAILTLPADLRRFGLVFHGPIQARVFAKAAGGNSGGELLWSIVPGSDGAAPYVGEPVRSHTASILEIGGGLRGALYIEYNNIAVDGDVSINELQYCGPENLE